MSIGQWGMGFGLAATLTACGGVEPVGMEPDAGVDASRVSNSRPTRGIDTDGVSDGSQADGWDTDGAVPDDAGEGEGEQTPQEDGATEDGGIDASHDAGEDAEASSDDAGEVGTDPCSQLTCENGGTCQAQGDTASCDCPPAWTGSTCAEDVDECALGTDSCNVPEFPCANVPGGYTCVGAMADWPIAKRTYDNVSFAQEGLIVDSTAGTILDEVTGLMWQRDLTAPSDFPTAQSDCASLQLAGFDDWRLPSMIELESWFTTPSLPRFPTGLFSTNPADLWSATPNSVQGQHVSAAMNVAYQYTRLDSDTKPAHLCVRTDSFKAQGTPAQRYDLQTDGVAYDQRTGLAWQRSDEGDPFTFDEADAYCDQLGLAGLTWRLPTFLELVSLYDWSRGLPAIHDTVFAGPYQRHFWTSTLSVTQQTHFQVEANFARWSPARGDDTGPLYNHTDSAPTYVRCVHEGAP